MIAWSDAYRRTVAESTDFRLLFGRMFRIDEFRYYAFPLKFEALQPALLAAAANDPNSGDMEDTVDGIAAPGVNLVPGEAAESLIDFPAGAIIIGITAAGILPQRIATADETPAAFAYGPSRNPGKRDLFMLDLEYADTSPITAGNPIPSLSISPTDSVNTAPPILADALCGGGRGDIMPARELLITPGLGILARVRSMVLPNAPIDEGYNAPNLSVHIVFHCMVPGVVKRKPAVENN